jgi:predicted glycosyltransferase
MLYSHDALGLGHVRRAIAIARAGIAHQPDLSVLLVTCSTMVGALPAPPELEIVKIPSMRKTGPSQYRPRTLDMELNEFRDWRAAILNEVANGFAPDFVLVDKSPLGLMGELAPALRGLRARQGTRTATGWRDILDSPALVAEEWRRQQTLEVLETRYDEIWVYGDPDVFDIREAYRMPRTVAERVRYLGYLAPRVSDADRTQARRASGAEEGPLAVVTMGGGEEGERVAACVLQAASRGLLPRDLRTWVITGPMMPRDAQDRLRARVTRGVSVRSFVPGLEKMIAAADVVVSRAGYNTVCEVLGSGTPAVLVPRHLHRDEQLIRARRLAEMHLARVVDEQEMEPYAMARAVHEGLEMGRRPCTSVRLGGLEETARQVSRMTSRSRMVA